MASQQQERTAGALSATHEDFIYSERQKEATEELEWSIWTCSNLYLWKTFLAACGEHE